MLYLELGRAALLEELEMCRSVLSSGHRVGLGLVPCRASNCRALALTLHPQVCDDEWHHYALNLEFPTVTLYTDGISFDPALIHDNGLIHPPRREPALMIGACWTGGFPDLLSKDSVGFRTVRGGGQVRRSKGSLPRCRAE